MIQKDDIQEALAYSKASKEKLETIQQNLATSFQVVCNNLAALQQKVPKDAGGDEDGTWSSIPEAEQEKLLSQIQDINEQLDAIYDQSRVATPSQVRCLFIYIGSVTVICLGLCFLCICKGAFPLTQGGDITVTHITSLTNLTTLTNANDSSTPLATLKHVTHLTNRITLKQLTALTNDITLKNGATLKNDAIQTNTIAITNGTLLASEHGSTKDDDARDENTIGTVDKVPHPAFVVLMVLSLGALGGCLRLIGSIGHYRAKEKLYASWLTYYYLTPIEGILLALFVCLMFKGGYFDLSSIKVNAVQTGESAVSSISTFYALACFSGLFAKNVLRKLKETVDILFGKVSNKDSA